MSTDTPRPENPELLAAIIAHPDEDTPRLMYADWLQENGDPDRAEFIRLHIEWDRRPPYAPPDDNLEQRLVVAWEASGLKKLGGIYERGFDSVAGFYQVEDLCARAESVFRSDPIRVVYTDQNCTLEHFPDWRDHFHAALTHAKGVTGLGAQHFRRGLGEYAEEFLQLPQAAELRMLDFGPSGSNYQCELVTNAKHLTNLVVLDMEGALEMEEGALELLSSAQHLRSLLALRLGENTETGGYIGERDIAALVSSPHITNLRQLTLNGHRPFDDQALRRLLEWEHVGRLEVLELYFTSVGADGLRLLSQCRQLSNLRRLAIDADDLEPEVITALLDSPHLRELRELYVGEREQPLPPQVQDRLNTRFGDSNWAAMTRDPPPVCVEDRIRGRYRSVDGSGGWCWGRRANRDPRTGRVICPEYAIL